MGVGDQPAHMFCSIFETLVKAAGSAYRCLPVDTVSNSNKEAVMWFTKIRI